MLTLLDHILLPDDKIVSGKRVQLELPNFIGLSEEAINVFDVLEKMETRTYFK